MSLHVIERGLDIPLLGSAEGAPVELEPPDTVACAPQELRGVLPRLDVREGDVVRAGQPLLHDRTHPEIKLLSAAGGHVAEVRRGKRRVITDVVVRRQTDDPVSFPAWTLARLETIDRGAAREALLAGGLWPLLRTRPLDNVADPGVVPQSILVGGMQTAPLMPGPDVLLEADEGDFVQAGVFALRALTNGPVFLAVAEGAVPAALARLRGIEAHQFRGPHPAGDPSVQVNHLDPPRGNRQVWWIRAWEVARIGRLLLEGRYPAERVYGAVGPAVRHPRFVRTLEGAPLRDVVGEVVPGPTRWIRGSALTGEAVDPGRWAGLYDPAVTVLVDEVKSSLFGWMAPQLATWSSHRAFLSGFLAPRRRVAMATGLWGGHRPIIPVDAYRRVVATPDIDAVFLFRSVFAGDIEESVRLGLLDLAREEAALLTFVCPAKTEFDVLLDEALRRYEEEL